MATRQLLRGRGHLQASLREALRVDGGALSRGQSVDPRSTLLRRPPTNRPRLDQDRSAASGDSEGQPRWRPPKTSTTPPAHLPDLRHRRQPLPRRRFQWCRRAEPDMKLVPLCDEYAHKAGHPAWPRSACVDLPASGVDLVRQGLVGLRRPGADDCLRDALLIM